MSRFPKKLNRAPTTPNLASRLLHPVNLSLRPGSAALVVPQDWSETLGGSVLIVDDDLGTGRLLALLIRHIGHEAAFVESGAQALEYLSTHRPDLVILDVMMPGIDGLEVLKRMRADPHTADLPVVMFSALSDPQFRQVAREKGANDYWVKASLDFRSLEERLSTFIPPAHRLPN